MAAVVRTGICFVALAMLFGCVTPRSDTRLTRTVVPPPTVAAIFQPLYPTPLPTPDAVPTPILLARTPDTVTQSRPRGMEDLIEVPLYSDQLAPGWTVQHSSNIVCDTEQQVNSYEGRRAIVCMPDGEDAKLFFTLDATTRTIIRRDRVVAISFFLSGGQDPIETDQLGVSMQGSNVYPYWVADDTSVRIKGRDTTRADTPLFTETALSFLGVNRTIQPDEWAQAILWLDNQIYDPDYAYLTGFYLKTDQDLTQRFYIDQVNLLVTK